MISARSLLVSYAVKCLEEWRNLLHIQRSFNRDDYTMAHMDNSSYADKSSLSDMYTVDSHDAALLLIQDATLNKPLNKSSVSNTGLIYTDPILRKTLSCQEVPPHAKPMNRPTLLPDIFLHPENKQATSLDMQTARSVADKREFLISLIWARQI